MTDGMTEYEVVTAQGTYRIEVPSSYRVTYGQVNPGAKGYGEGMVLRVYEDASKEKQRALFANVLTFRDTTIPVKKLAVRKPSAPRWYDPSWMDQKTHPLFQYTGELEYEFVKESDIIPRPDGVKLQMEDKPKW